MQIKLELSAEQLDALHKEIQKPENKFFEDHGGGRGQHKHFVWIMSVEGTGKEMYPIPKYKVAICATESYRDTASAEFKTPLVHVQNILQAIGLFPSEEGVYLGD